MPARKKDPSTRARKNKASTAATLSSKPGLVAVENFDDMTVADLRAAIEQRNADGRPDERMLSAAGRKAELIAVLVADSDPTPQLPERLEGWHSLTREWWADVWASPMSGEWHSSDRHNVLVCAMLYDDMWRGETATARSKAASEFRQQRASLGLTPYDRRRLEWTIESAEEAKDRGAQRRRTPAKPAPGASSRPDPRAGLHAVN